MLLLRRTQLSEIRCKPKNEDMVIKNILKRVVLYIACDKVPKRIEFARGSESSIQ